MGDLPAASVAVRAPATSWRVHGAAVGGLVRGTRPKQWIKNLLVAAAPAAAGVLGEAAVALDVALAFAALCLVAGGTYLLNDVRDVEADRRHPRKRHRPVAAGVVSPRLAVGAGAVLVLAGFGVAFAVNPAFAGVVAGYVALTASYTLWLKHIAVLDIAAVAGGFIIRAAAGGVAVDVPLSRWFLIVASFGSLFVVAGKRYGEHLQMGTDRAVSRPILGSYSSGYLRNVTTMASAITVTAYCLWAFEQSVQQGGFPGHELSVIPLVVWVLRYSLLIETGAGESPEELVVGDPTLRWLSVAWVLAFGCGVYLGG